MSGLRPVVVKNYIELARHIVPEFWEPSRVLAVRKMAQTAEPVLDRFEPEKFGRLLDRMVFRDLRRSSLEEAFRIADKIDVDIGVNIGATRLEMPIYVGDMSFGALSGNPNIAIAKAVTEVGLRRASGRAGCTRRWRSIEISWFSGPLRASGWT
jgi:glutamate synthase domain-containing protein 2